MTGNEVPSVITRIKCYRCGGLYTTDKQPVFGFGSCNYEKCPICGCGGNDRHNRISITKFKFIRWWRVRRRSQIGQA